mgnify:CR=1 FL=1
MSTNNDVVVILTALPLEYEAVRERLTDLRIHRHRAGTHFEVGRIRQSDCRVALTRVGVGNNTAAVLAERAMTEFSPAAVLFVGVAGAMRPHIKLGDIVIANKIYAYHGGTSEDDGLKARPKAWEIPHEADQIAHHVARSNGWRRHLPAGAKPTVHFGPIAAGEVVQDSAISEQARWLRQHYNDTAAIEMEAAGVAQAAHLNRALPVVIVRGISDHADGTKAATDGQNWQPRAARHAAVFATALAQELIRESVARQAETARQDRSQFMHTTNIATGNARVGVQAGQIHGTVIVRPDTDRPVDLEASIADLRNHLKQALLAGHLDEETYTAAESELDVVSDCVREGAAAKKGRLLLALKRLRGLVADVTELAVRLAALITVVQGLP